MPRRACALLALACGRLAHADDAWAALGVKSIGDLGSWKFAAAAHAIATLAECEASDVSQHK